MAFPTNPVNGDQFVANGAKYTYIAAKNAWIKAATQDINAISANTLVTTGNITSSTNITATTGVFPATDNTGTVGNASLTWNGGQFTNLTVDNTLTVTNTLDVRAAIDLADDDILRFGTSDDMEIYHAAAGENRIDLTVGDLVIRDDADAGDAIRFTFGRTTGDLTVSGNATTGNLSTSAATITSNTATTSTTTGALQVAGGVGIVGNLYTGGNVDIVSNVDITPGTNWDGQLTINGNGYSGGISLDSTGMWVGHNSASRQLIFATDDTARARIDTSGHLVPATNSTYDLGTTTLRWRNIYTQDLQLSNGIGDYTVVEGEEDLFLYNNKTGRVFKFALIEVDPSEAPPKFNDL